MSCIMSTHHFFCRPRLRRPLTSAVIILFKEFSSSLLIKTVKNTIKFNAKRLDPLMNPPRIFTLAASIAVLYGIIY